jgi:hypothetical protein
LGPAFFFFFFLVETSPRGLVTGHTCPRAHFPCPCICYLTGNRNTNNKAAVTVSLKNMGKRKVESKFGFYIYWVYSVVVVVFHVCLFFFRPEAHARGYKLQIIQWRWVSQGMKWKDQITREERPQHWGTLTSFSFFYFLFLFSHLAPDGFLHSQIRILFFLCFVIFLGFNQNPFSGTRRNILMATMYFVGAIGVVICVA